MSDHRFFLDDSLPSDEGAEVALPLDHAETHHMANALRLSPGDPVVVVEPDRTAWRVRLTHISGEHAKATVEEKLDSAPEAAVTLIQGVAKGERVDLVVEKAVEIGVEAVWPVVTERAVVRWDAQKRASRGERWRRVAHAAAKQSKRSFVPHVTDPTDFGKVVDALDEFDAVLVLWEESHGSGIGVTLAELGVSADSRVALVVGPEGGLADWEVEALERRGAKVASMGENILRSETGGIVAAALCVYELGGLGGRPRG